MQVWWCVALWACARAARPDVPLAEPRDGHLTPAVMQQAIETEMEDLASEQDPMLAGLRDAGRARAALCGGGRGCAGALWGRRWLLARASCAGALPLRHASVLPHRGVAGCGPGATVSGAIPVLARFVHPQYFAEAGGGGAGGAGGAHDAALLLLAAPAPVPSHANHSRALTHVPELERWLQYIPAALPASWDRPPAPARGLDVTNSPLRLLAAAVLLPAAALLLLFALALRLPDADGIRAELLDHDALEHAHAPSDDDDEKPSAPLESPTTDRLDFL